MTTVCDLTGLYFVSCSLCIFVGSHDRRSLECDPTNHKLQEQYTSIRFREHCVVLLLFYTFCRHHIIYFSFSLFRPTFRQVCKRLSMNIGISMHIAWCVERHLCSTLYAAQWITRTTVKLRGMKNGKRLRGLYHWNFIDRCIIKTCTLIFVSRRL